MTPVDVRLESTAEDVMKMFAREAESVGIDLQLHIDDSCQQSGVVNVSLDPNRVLQILINLLTNAIKFTRLEIKRQIKVTLSVSSERPTQNSDGDIRYMPRSEQSIAKTLAADWRQGEAIFVSFSVADTGAGMSEAEHRQLFLRFSQTTPRTHIDYGGSGLGLYISRRLTEMHGGAIGFKSQEGLGSTFSFYVQGRRSRSSMVKEEHGERIPDISRPRISPFDVAWRTNSHNGIKSADLVTKSLNDDNVCDANLHILIVEDNVVNQRVLAQQLRNLGMQVAVVNHGGEALKYLESTRYWKSSESTTELTIILMDWEMLVMNGLQCVREIRRLQQQGTINGYIPVIAVTANVRSEQIAIALDAGMDNVVSKPFRIPELRDRIQETLRSRAELAASSDGRQSTEQVQIH